MKEIDKKIKNKFFIVIGVNIIILSLFFLLIYFAGNVGNTEMNKSITSLRELENMQTNFSTYNRAIKETEAERAILDNFVINKQKVAKVVGLIEDLAKHSHVEISKTISVEKNPTQPKENILKFSVRARGASDDVFYFLTLLENMPYKLRFRSLAMGMSDSDIRSDLMSTSFRGQTTSSAKNSVWAGEASFEILSYINE